jgi:predicted phosphoribosyltransferase
MAQYADRREAGKRLAEELREQYSGGELVVLGLPRGGVVVAAEVARGLGAPLDVVSVRKLGAPGQPELALGAVAEGGVVLVSRDLVSRLEVSEEYVDHEVSSQLQVVRERAALFREDKGPVPLEGRLAVVVDDGIATGSTAEAALMAVGERGPSRRVLAVPVASTHALGRLGEMAEVICPTREQDLGAVGSYYDSFTPVSDEEVTELLAHAGD